MVRATLLVLLALVAGSNALLGVIQSSTLNAIAAQNMKDPITGVIQPVLPYQNTNIPNNGLYKEFIQPNHDFLLLSNPESVNQDLVSGLNTINVPAGPPPAVRPLFARDPLVVATIVAAGPAATYKVGDKVVFPTQCANSAQSFFNGLAADMDTCTDACTNIYSDQCRTCRIPECYGGIINQGTLFSLIPQGLILGHYKIGGQVRNDGVAGVSRFSNPNSWYPVA